MASSYPEHEKMQAIKDESQSIGAFLDWLCNENGIELCRFSSHNDNLMPTNEGIEKLLARYFKIDLKKIEREKLQMLDEMRKAG